MCILDVQDGEKRICFHTVLIWYSVVGRTKVVASWEIGENQIINTDSSTTLTCWRSTKKAKFIHDTVSVEEDACYIVCVQPGEAQPPRSSGHGSPTSRCCSYRGTGIAIFFSGNWHRHCPAETKDACCVHDMNFFFYEKLYSIFFSNMRAAYDYCKTKKKLIQYSITTQMEWTLDGHKRANQLNTNRKINSHMN